MAPSGRAYWKGFLRLSLVSISVEVFSAEDRRADIRFNQIHKPSGKRVNYTKTVKGLGPVETKDIVSGYEIDDDNYVVLEPEEIAALKLDSKRTIELTQFVPESEIDPRYFEEPYYVVPADEYAVEGYQVIREALRKAGKCGIGQLTHGGREHLVAVSPLDRGLSLNRLRYANEIKGLQAFFGDIPALKLDPEMVAIASELIDRKSGDFHPEEFSDRYAVELRKLIDKKAKGERIVTAPEPEPQGGNVINLMDALRRSLGQPGGSRTPPPHGTPRKTGPRQSARRAERAKPAKAAHRARSR